MEVLPAGCRAEVDGIGAKAQVVAGVVGRGHPFPLTWRMVTKRLLICFMFRKLFPTTEFQGDSGTISHERQRDQNPQIKLDQALKRSEKVSCALSSSP